MQFMKEYGRCGIIEVCLSDPLTRLINKFISKDNDDINGVGIYYHDINQSVVMIYNWYDNEPIPWMKSEISLERLFRSYYITKINFYPLDERLEEILRFKIVRTLSDNSRKIGDKYNTFSNLLFYQSINDKITGYSLVNQIILSLMHSKDNPYNDRLMRCPYIKQNITIRAPEETPDPSETNYVINETLSDINLFISCFLNLFISSSQFQYNILKRRRTLRINVNKEALRNLYDFINKIIKDNRTILDLSELIRSYNLLSKGTQLPTISYPENFVRNITLVSSETIDVNINKKNIIISTKSPDLSELSMKQLEELLLYFDSLRMENRVDDELEYKYSNIENQIIMELALKK
jgi:hypothetical protein